MSYQLKPWELPTGGAAPVLRVGYGQGDDGRTYAQNLSAWNLHVRRADGRREVLRRAMVLPLDAGDEVVQPISVTEPVEPAVLRQAKLAGFRAFNGDLAERLEAASNDEPPPPDPERWYWHVRVLEDGQRLTLFPASIGNARLTISADEMTWDAGWCYHDHDAAWRAVLGWNGQGDPEGWYRCLNTGRRRPDGTPESEYVQAFEVVLQWFPQLRAQVRDAKGEA